MTSSKRFLTYLSKQKGLIVLIVISALLFVVCNLMQPLLIGRALDYATADDQQTFIILLVVCGVLLLIGVVFEYIFEYSVNKMTQNIIQGLRNDTYEKINNVSIATLNNDTVGHMVQMEIGDIENIANGLFAVFKSLIEGVLSIVVTLILMFTVNWILAIGVFLLSPLSFFMSRFVARFNDKHFKEQASLQSELNSISLEAISNSELLTSMNYQKETLDKFQNKDEELRKVGKVAQFSASWINPSTRLVNNIIYAIIGVVGIIMISYDGIASALAGIMAAMSIGRLSSFLSYTNQYTKPFNDISSVMGEYQTAKSSFNRINEFLNENNDIDEGKETIDSINSIEFKNMSFSYRENQHLIENFNQVIKKGQKVAIVGPTGAGKTTLVNLLMRFYDPDCGEILYNGVSSKDINKDSLRSNFGMVLQETWIFNGTVMENIRYSKPDASDEEVINAAKKAHADSFINSLPDGYNTVISSKEGLSEGERQMIAIARAMLLEPSIVILDEATSNVDTRTEKLINNAFDELMKDRTSIVIAHRLSTIQEADAIIVLKDGSIVETGNHQSLMKQQGFYYELYSSQFK